MSSMSPLQMADNALLAAMGRGGLATVARIITKLEERDLATTGSDRGGIAARRV